MKNISISNIAWPATADEEALGLAADLQFSGIEIAPAKVFGSLDDATPAACESYRRRLSDIGLSIPAMQAILFGVPDVHLFRSTDQRLALASRLDQISRIAESLRAGACVFGSPTLRDPEQLSDADAWNIAVEFFTSIADKFEIRGVALCFEANPTAYNCRFVNHTCEAHRLVEAVGMPGFKLQLDTGTMFMNDENLSRIPEMAAAAGHFHISEPQLGPVGKSSADHLSVAAALSNANYSNWVSIEMKATDDWETAMKRSADVASAIYAPALNLK